MSGIRRIAIEVLTSSGSVGAHSRKACSTAGASSPAKKMPPPNSEGTGTSSISSAVTMPKLPLPPRTAQNSSGSDSAQTRRSRPSAVTISTAVHVVGGEAVLAAERAHAAAEGVADDADVGRRPAQPGQPELGGGLQDAVPLDAGLDAGDPPLGVDGDALHAAGGDHQRAGGVADRAVPGGLDGDARGRARRPRRRRRRRRRRRWRPPRSRGCAGRRRSRWPPRRPCRRRRRRRRGRAPGCGARRRRRPGVARGQACRGRRRSMDGGRRLGLSGELGEAHQGVFLWVRGRSRSWTGREESAGPPWRILAATRTPTCSRAGRGAKGVPRTAPACEDSRVVRYRVLGPLEVTGPDGQPVDVGGAKPRALLTLLLADAGRVVGIDRIVEHPLGRRPAADGDRHAAGLRLPPAPGPRARPRAARGADGAAHPAAGLPAAGRSPATWTC